MSNLSNSFTDDDLRSMIVGDNPLSNAYRELLAYREAKTRNSCIGYVSKKAVNRMYNGMSSFCALFPEPEREYRIAVYLKPFTAPPLPAVPDGWALVPIEITDNIAEAISKEANCCGGIAVDIYDAIIKSSTSEAEFHSSGVDSANQQFESLAKHD